MTRLLAFGMFLATFVSVAQAQSVTKFDADTQDLRNIACDAPDLVASVVTSVNESASLKSRKATILRVYDIVEDVELDRLRRDQAIASLAEAMNATPAMRKDLENGGMRTNPLISHSCRAAAITNRGSFHISYYLMPDLDDGGVLVNVTQRTSLP